MKKILLYLKQFFTNALLYLGIKKPPQNLKIRIDLPPERAGSEAHLLNAAILPHTIKELTGKEATFTFTGPELPPYLMILIKGVVDDVQVLTRAGYEVEVVK